MGLFGFGNKYPYTDFHELNLDWILGVIRSLQSEMQTFVNVNTIKYADPILWDISSQYEQNTLVQDADGITYLSKQAVPAGISINNTDYWLKVADFSQLADIIKRSICSQDDGASSTSTDNRAEGDLLWLNNYLYKVLRTINIGDAYVEGGVNPNIEKVTVEQLIDDVLSQGGIIKESIAAADDADSATSTANRSEGELVWLNERLFEVIAPITAGDTYVIGTNIQAVTIEQLFDDLRNDISTLIIPALDMIRSSIASANDHDSATSSANRSIGSLVWLNDTLYIVISPISTGDTYTVGTNIQAVTVEQIISTIQGDITTIQGQIAGLTDPAVANVKDYGAVGDGITNDTISINLAIADINAGTKTVLYFPEGVYLVESLTPITEHALIKGLSRDSSKIIRKSSALDAVFTIDNSPLGEICDLSFEDENSNHTEPIVKLYRGNFYHIHNIFINVSRFILLGDPSSTSVDGYYTQIDHVNGLAYISFVLMNGARSVNYITNCGVNSDPSYTNTCAIEINNPNSEYDTLVVQACIFQLYYYGFVMNNPAGHPISNLYVINTIFDGMYSRTITANISDHLYRFRFVNSWISNVNTNTLDPILLQTVGAGVIADIGFYDMIVPYCYNYVMTAQNIKGLQFVNCVLPSFVNNGLVIDDCEYVQVTNCKIGPNGSNTSGTYVNGIVARRDNNIVIVGCDLSGCTTGIQWGSGADACTHLKSIGNINTFDTSDEYTLGQVYYDTGAAALKYWDGSAWVNV